MNIYHIMIIIWLHLTSYILNYMILKYILSYISIYMYISIINTLLLISIVDSYNLLTEKENLYIDYKNTHKLLELQLIENKKLQEIINCKK
jgi:amino acid transporter